MNELDRTSILRMAMGAIEERVNYEMGRVLDNILDVNTEAKKKRKMIVTLEFLPDADRRTIQVCAAVKSALVPTDPVLTSLYVSSSPSTGEMEVYEMVPQIPGQQAIDGSAQEEPKVLKFEKRA